MSHLKSIAFEIEPKRKLIQRYSSMEDAIAEGKRIHAAFPELGTLEKLIKYEVSTFIWETHMFIGDHLKGTEQEIFELLKNLTK